MPVPAHVHWDLFLGPAPERPYNPVYHPHNWRGWWDFGTGSLGDMACHTANLAFMALQLGLPVRVSAKSGEINSETYPAWATITYEFPARGNLPPVKLTWYEGAKDGKRNLPPDDLFPDRGFQPFRQRLALDRLEVADVLAQRLWCGPDALAQGRRTRISRSPSPRCLASRAPRDIDDNQKREWVQAIRAGKPALALSNFDYSSTLTESMLLGNVAVRSGQAIDYNPETGEIAGSSEPVAVPQALFPQGMGNLSDVLVEEAYFNAWGKVGGAGRLRRSFSLFVSMRRMLELQVKNQNPGLSERELAWRTAKRMYFSDQAAQRLLDRMEQTTVTADDFPETIERLLPILKELGLKFHFTGGIAASYYGDPRFTQDLDLVIDSARIGPKPRCCSTAFPPDISSIARWQWMRSSDTVYFRRSTSNQ